jgi:hypothetical protein
MKPIYTEINHEFHGKTIQADYGDGRILSIPCNLENADYQRYLAWLENPEAEQSTPSVINEAETK